MKENGLIRSIINAVIMEEKKKVIRKPRDLFYNQKKQKWYRIMDFIDGLEEETPEETEAPNT